MTIISLSHGVKLKFFAGILFEELRGGHMMILKNSINRNRLLIIQSSIHNKFYVIMNRQIHEKRFSANFVNLVDASSSDVDKN